VSTLPVPRWKDKACKEAHPQDAEFLAPELVPELCVAPDQPCFRCELPQINTPHTFRNLCDMQANLPVDNVSNQVNNQKPHQT
jgi:hypothetical protein